MKRIARKVLAFVLAMALCVTQLALPAMADTTTETNPDGSTTTTTTSSSTDSSGATTSSVESTTTSADGNTTTTTTDTTTTSSSSSGGSTTTTTSSTSTSETNSSSSTTSPDGSSGSSTSSHAESETKTDTTSTTTTTDTGSNTVTNTETNTKAEASTQTQNYFPGGTSGSASGSGSTSNTKEETTTDVTDEELMGEYEDTQSKDVKGEDSSTTFAAGDVSDPKLEEEGTYETDSSYGTSGSKEVSTEMDFVGHTFEMKQSDIGEGTSATYEATYADDGILIQVLPGDFFEQTGTETDGTPVMGLKQSGSEVTVGNRTWTMEYTEGSDGKVHNVTLTSSAIPEECYENNQLKASGTEVEMDGKKWTMNYQTDADGNRTGEVTFTLATGADANGIVWDGNTPTSDDTGWQSTGAASTPSSMTADDYTGLGITPSYTDPDTNANVSLPAVDFSQTGETELKDANGNVIGKRTITPETDANGNVTYKITDEVYLSDLTPDSNGNIVAESDQGQQTVTETNVPGKDDGKIVELKPAGTPPTPYSTSSNGITETLRVETFRDAYDFAAYRTILTVVDEITGAYYTEEHEYYATVQTTTENIVTTPETGKRTMTIETVVENGQKSTQAVQRDYDTGEQTTVKFMDTQELVIVESAGEMFLEYEGVLYKVQGYTNRDGQFLYNGASTINSIAPGFSYDTSDESKKYYWNGEYQLMNPEEWGSVANTSPDEGYEWSLSGNGLFSQYLVKYNSGQSDRDYTRQYVLKNKDGQTVYAYCIDKNVAAVDGANYDMDNVVSSGYTNDTVSKQIEYAALNGYWGTTSGTGSLDKVKQLLRDNSNLTEDQISKLSHGAALAATQAALWALSNDNGIVDIDYMKTHNIIALDFAYAKEKNWEVENVHLVVNTLFAILVDESKAEEFNRAPADGEVKDYNKTVELLDEDNFATEVSLRVESKVTKLDVDTFNSAYSNDEAAGGYYGGTSENSDGDIVDSDGNVLFNTQMDFIVDVKQSDLTGNLTVRIIDADGNTIAKKQLATEDSNFFGKAIAGGTKTQYTFKNLILPNDSVVTLTIDGLQDMKEGAYLYSASNGRSASQTFVGIASGEHEVHLSVGMKFTVTDPGANVSVETERERQKKVDTYKNTQEGTQTDCSVETTTTVTMKTKVYGTKVHTKVVTEKTEENWKWNSYAEYLMTTVWDEDGGGGGGNVNQDGLNIPDEAVPLAAAPKTGDASQILAIVCLISLAGAWCLSRKEIQV